MDALLAITLEIESFNWIGKTPFELLKDEQEGVVANVVAEKQVSALNGSIIKFFK